MVTFGVMAGFLSQFFYMLDGIENYSWPSGCAWIVMVACIILLGLAPLQDDIRLTRFVLVANMFNAGLDFFWHGRTVQAFVDSMTEDSCEYFGTPIANSYCVLSIVCGGGYLAADVIFALGSMMSACFCRTASSMQAQMWGHIVLYMLIMLAFDVAYAAGTGWEVHKIDGTLMFVATDVLGLVAALHPSLRTRLHSWLIQWFDAAGATAAAAGIAGLVGNCSEEKALSEASHRFRAIGLDQLSFDCFRTSPIHESSTLFEQASQVKLGSCDAFISHSWHDDPVLKYESLKRWQSTFTQEKGRVPMVWFDKACIDQNNIEDDLRCLPIFLAGCKDLLVFCGPTYLSRLWCIMEMFTFVHMGGSVDRITMLPLVREEFQSEDEAMIREGFRNFDAEVCECFCSDDKERMLSIISTAFGGIGGFNNAIRRIIEQAELDSTPKEGRWVLPEVIDSNESSIPWYFPDESPSLREVPISVSKVQV